MLTSLRKHGGGLIAKIFMGLLVVSFGVWGIADIFNGLTKQSIATVGHTAISTDAFQRDYTLATRNFAKSGQPLTPDQARLAGIPNLVLSRLINEEAYRQDAADLGLGITPDALNKEIVADPNFRGAGGTYDRNAVAAYIQNRQLSEAAFMAERVNQSLQGQLGGAVTAGLTVPDAYARAVHQYRNEARTIDFITLPATLAGEIAPPTSDDLTAYFTANKGQWRIPEYRAVTVLTVDPADLADPSKISDADARAAYNNQPGRFTTAEKRHVRQIRFDDKAKADAAAAELQNGKTFDDLVTEQNLKAADVDLGTIVKSAIVDKKVADAAFTLAADTTSGVIAGDFGPVIVAVSEVSPAATQSFDDVKESLKRDIANQRAQASLLDLHDKIVDAQSGGDTLAEAAKKFNRTPTVIPAVDRTGKTPDGATLNLPQSTSLLAAIFESDVGIANEPLPSAARGFVWFDVTAVTAARDPALTEVTDKVTAAWTKEQTNAKVIALAKGIAARLTAGEAFDKIGDEMKLTVQTKEKLTRDASPEGDLTAEVIRAAYSGKEGLATVAAGAIEGSEVVLKVTKVEVPPFVPGDLNDAQIMVQLNNALGADIVDQYGQGLESRFGVSIDQPALQRAVGGAG